MKKSRVALLLVLFLLPGLLVAQGPKPKQPKPVSPLPPVRQYQSKSLIVSSGFGFPLSRKGITDFWKAGPSGSAQFLVNINRNAAIGIGLDASTLYFRRGAFAGSYPGVPVQARNLGFFCLYLAATYTPMPGKRLMPFVEANIGAARLTGAIYQEMINGVRVTYYSIPGTMRLALAAAGGVDLVFNSRLAFRGEVKATYLNNDPDLGIELGLRGGLRFRL